MEEIFKRQALPCTSDLQHHEDHQLHLKEDKTVFETHAGDITTLIMLGSVFLKPLPILDVLNM